MKRFLLISLSVLITAICPGKNLPRVHIIATGGTIAGVSDSKGYTAARVDAASLISAVDGLDVIADISFEQFVSVASQDMNEKIWLSLSKRVDQVLDSVDAVVITHGTDTMDETATFLALTLHSDKPVVITGAMRPSDAPDADGPRNIFSSVKAAAAGKKGVSCCMGGELLSPFAMIKIHTTDKGAFVGRGDKPKFEIPRFDISKKESLPQVGIVYCYAGDYTCAAEGFIQSGCSGLVLAGVGNGNCSKEIFKLTAKVPIVRASRVPFGDVTRHGEVDDIKAGTVASGRLTPQQSRILLMLLLSNNSSMKEIRSCFEKF